MTSLVIAEQKARKIVNGWTCGALAVGWVPGSCLVLTPSDMIMVALIAETFEVENYSEETLLAALTAQFSGHTLADLGLSLIPVLGWGVKAIVAAVVTKAAGEVIINYFKDRSPYNPNKIHHSENNLPLANFVKPLASMKHNQTVKMAQGIKMLYDTKEKNWEKLQSDVKDILS